MDNVDLSLFRFHHPIEVRYADIDSLHHVNNAKYFTYLETARVRYFREVVGWQGNLSSFGVILARAECDYLVPIRLDHTVCVHLRTARIGEKSFTFEYVITVNGCAETYQAAARAATVQVAYDYTANTSIRVPQAWREAITAFEPGLD